jgi:S1-C subfamily serine protease
MQQDDNGSEQRSGWQPPEYVNPWASTSGTGGEGEHGETVSFGMSEDEPGYSQPTAPIFQPASSWRSEPEPPPQIWDPASSGAGGPGGSGGSWPGYGVPEMPGYERQRGALGRFLVYAAVAVLAAGVGAGAAVWLNTSSNNQSNISSQNVPFPGSNNGGSNNNSGNSGSAGGTINQQRVASQVDPGIVDVVSTLSYNSETAEGTGMVLTSTGLVLTNNHVIDQATSVRATLVESGRNFTAKVLGYDSANDVALLQLEGATGLKTVTLGNSNAIRVGQAVLALGNAEGRGGMPTPAQGTVGSLHRTINAGDSSNSALTETLHDMIQTDAPIQQGDSGGPLVDSSGHVIGMDTAANTNTNAFGQGTPATTGFAIPINNALSIAREIDAGHPTGTVHIGLAGFMGITVTDISQAEKCLAIANNNGLGGDYTPQAHTGGVICQVYPDTPAATAGLAPGDIIVSANGQSIANSSGLTKVIEQSHPGTQVHITYVDNSGRRHSISFSLIAIAK